MKTELLVEVLKMTPEEQRVLINEIYKAQRKGVSTPRGRAKNYIDILCDISNVHDFDLHIRRREFVLVKAICAYQLYNEGITFTEIGGLMGCDHSTINHYLDKMDDIFSLPKIYGKEIGIYNEFKKRIR